MLQDNHKTESCQEPSGNTQKFLTASEALQILRNSALRMRSRAWLKTHLAEIPGVKRIRHPGRYGGFDYRIPLSGLEELIVNRLQDVEQPLSAAEICHEETRGLTT
jgi:hypothetical protein